MIMCIGLWIAGVVLGFFGMAVKELYNPAKRMSDIFLTFYLVFTLGIQLLAIYFTALRSPLLAMPGVMVFDYYWFAFAPFYPNSDAAGNGMAWGFRSMFIFGGSFIFGIISYLLMKFLVVGGRSYGLYFVLTVAGFIGLGTIRKNRNCFLNGDAFVREASWAYMKADDYRRSLLRESMVEKNDSWDSKELDADPEELEHWDVYGCKCVNIRTNGQLSCELLEGTFEYPRETRRALETGLNTGCIGYTREIDANDRTIFVPHTITLVWRDLTDGKTYKIHTALPKELDRYFEDTDRFWLDDIELRIFPWGKVLMYHNRRNQIHNIMMDYPLMGEETDAYVGNEEEKEVSGEALERQTAEIQKLSDHGKISVEQIRKMDMDLPDPDTINEYLRRYKYTISFTSDDEQIKITKTICNFFNGEKILSDGEWKEEMNPARIKDVFLRFENGQDRYAAFIYFQEEEILKVFEKLAEVEKTDPSAEFIITCGEKQDAFSFTLKLNDRSYSPEETEIRLYKVDEQERGKLVFKNYKGDHKNRSIM